MGNKDTIYNKSTDKTEPFVFNETVAQVFPDMIRRSVPGYDSVIDGTGLIASNYMQPQSNAYDLGCSTGASTLAMLRYITCDDFSIIAIDNSPYMIERCRKNIHNSRGSDRVSYQCEDVLDIVISNASVVVLNYTLQFIPPQRRTALLTKIYDGMSPDGVLILSEKLAFDNQIEQIRQTALHESFKRAKGYSELEISCKRAALENVLVPESYATHLGRLNDIGFHDAQLWFRSINFASMLAWK